MAQARQFPMALATRAACSTALLATLLVLLASLHALPRAVSSSQCNAADKQCATDASSSQSEFEFAEGAGPGVEDASSVKVDVDKLQKMIDTLAAFTDDPSPAVTRIVFTETDLQGRKYVKELMSEVGLSIREDAVGNIFGRWEGSEPALGGVLTGSHTDAIPLAGKYDGVLGVLGPIAAVAALKEAGFKPRRSIEVLMFTSEEPTRFGYGCSGSRLMANQSGFASRLLQAQDKWGLSFNEAATSAGYRGLGTEELVQSVIIPEGNYSAFVELHIEQARVLEDEGIPIGVVSHIAAPAALAVEFSGAGGHAGGLLMPYRNDAGLAAAELALAVEEAVLGTKSIDTVGTAGHVTLEPNAINSVPRKARIEIDIRDVDEDRRDRVVAQVEKSARAIAEKRGVKLERFDIINADPPATCSSRVTGAASKAADELGLKHRALVSRAYHDSLFMARIAPTGMIFIPCLKGMSHRPDEFASLEDMKNGVTVLALTLAKLSLLA